MYVCVRGSNATHGHTHAIAYTHTHTHTRKRARARAHTHTHTHTYHPSSSDEEFQMLRKKGEISLQHLSHIEVKALDRVRVSGYKCRFDQGIAVTITVALWMRVSVTVTVGIMVEVGIGFWCPVCCAK